MTREACERHEKMVEISNYLAECFPAINSQRATNIAQATMLRYDTYESEEYASICRVEPTEEITSTTETMEIKP
jgi:hypothetical protein